MKPRIVVIGAGSASFGPTTLASIMRSKKLKGATVALVDFDKKSLANLTQLAIRLNMEWDAGMQILSNTDRREVLLDADFVIVSIEVPPREHLWRLDWEIPVKHGLRQPYGENGGPGGFMHACRQIPPFMAIARDMEALCPKAWLINFSNPLPRITRAVTKYSNIKILGKCHQLDVGYGIAAVLLSDHFGYAVPVGVDFHSNPANTRKVKLMASIGRQKLDIKAAGLNHFTWMLEVRDRENGEDLYPALRAAALNPPKSLEPLSMELFRNFDYCPVPGDSHLCEYLPWTHDVVSRPWEYFNIRLYDWEANEAQRHSNRTAVVNMANGDLPVDVLANSPSEGAVELIEAIAWDESYYDDAVNLPNTGHITNLPDGTIVEVPALVSGESIESVGLAPLPDPIAELCRREAALVELVVDAAVTGDRRLALHALLLDPMINDIGRAKVILDDYLTTFADYLPQFVV